jgi:hypothetical protein
VISGIMHMLRSRARGRDCSPEPRHDHLSSVRKV